VNGIQVLGDPGNNGSADGEKDGPDGDEGYASVETVQRIIGDDTVDVEVIRGGDGGDLLVGDENTNPDVSFGGPDEIFGKGGADVVRGFPGNDTIDGGAGNDYLNGGDGDDSVMGDADDDTLEGGAGNDTLEGGGGFDVAVYPDLLSTDYTVTLQGSDIIVEAIDGSERDVLRGVELVRFADERFVVTEDSVFDPGATAVLLGTSGPDTLEGTEDDEFILGSNGDDSLDGRGGEDTIDGGPGNDSLIGGLGGDTLLPGTGNDTVDGGASLNSDLIDTVRLPDNRADYDYASYFTLPLLGDIFILEGPSGTKQLSRIERIEFADGSASPIFDFDGTDSLTGTGGSDQLFGLEGADRIEGGGGNDSLYGGELAPDANLQANLPNDPDTLIGGAGNDLLLGLGGDDSLDGGADDDTLEGGDGNDTLDGGGGNNLLEGGAGNDRMLGFGVIGSPPGNDTLRGGEGNDFVSGFAGDDLLEGGSGIDTVVGSDGADSLDGGDGDDFLNGGAGDDLLEGGPGTDTAEFFGDRSDYRIELLRGGADPQFVVIGPQGEDTLRSIERIGFENDIFNPGFEDVIDDIPAAVDGGVKATIDILARDAVLPEGDSGTALFTFDFVRSDRLDVGGSVEYRLIGNGVEPDDFVGGLPVGGIGFTAGAARASVTVEVAGDTELEGDEIFGLELINPSSSVEIGVGTAFATIVNDDTIERDDRPENVLRGTPREDVIASAASATYLPGPGEDIFVVNQATAPGVTSVFSGAPGERVQFVPGLRIIDALVAPNALQVELEGGGVVQIINAAQYEFEVGGNVTTGATGTVVDFETLVQSLFGVEVPASGFATGSGARIIDAVGFAPRADVTPPPMTPVNLQRGSSSEDLLVVSAGATYLGGAGGDTFALTEAILADQTSVINGGQADEVELLEGLGIASARVLPDAIELSFEGGGIVQILQADQLTFDVGGNATQRIEGDLLGFEDFVELVLGGEVPNTGIVETGPATVGFPQLRVAGAEAEEGDTGTNGELVFDVELSAPSAAPVSVDYTVLGRTAEAGVDFSATSGTLTIPAGETAGEIAVGILGDDLPEFAETLRLVLSSPQGAELVNDVATGTILNDDVAGLSISDAEVTEGGAGDGRMLDFTLSLDQPAVTDVEVVVASTSAGTAEPGVDFEPIEETVTIPAGETAASAPVAVIGDELDEPDETVALLLSEVTGAEIIDGDGEGVILDDDLPLTLVDGAETYAAQPGPEIFEVRIDSSNPERYTNPDFDGVATIDGFNSLEDVLRFVEQSDNGNLVLNELQENEATDAIEVAYNGFEQRLQFFFGDDPAVPGTTGATLDLTNFVLESSDYIEIA